MAKGLKVKAVYAAQTANVYAGGRDEIDAAMGQGRPADGETALQLPD